MKQQTWHTPDGAHTVMLEAQVGKYVIWADEEYAGDIYPGSGLVMGLSEQTLELFGAPANVMLYRGGAEVFLNGFSLHDGATYATRKEQLMQPLRVRVYSYIGAGFGLLCFYCLVLLLGGNAARWASMAVIGAMSMILGLVMRKQMLKLC